MLKSLFLTVLNMSVTASCVVAALCVLRLLLKRAPKWISYAMWSVAFLRAVCPVSFSSVISLFQGLAPAQSAVEGGALRHIPADIGARIAPRAGGFPSLGGAFAEPSAGAAPAPDLVALTAWVWLIGMGLMLAYAAVSYALLRRKVSDAVRVEGNVYESDRIPTAFVCGFLRPRIYLPLGLDERSRGYVLSHERAHIARGDQFVKPLAFLALTLHWFNPLLWAAYRLMARDMEMSCDERALKAIGIGEKPNYCAALLALSTRRPGFAAGPLAFGEGGAKARIKNALSYKKPAFWAAAAALVAVLAVGLVLLANPKTRPPEEEAAFAAPAITPTAPPIAPTQAPLAAAVDAPEGFIVNEVGASDQEIAAVFALVRKNLPAKLENVGFHLYFYARREWHDGALLAAGESPRGETAAELYYVVNGEVRMHTRWSEFWYLNYTHFEGETIVYGESFAWDNRPLATDEVRAQFYDGTIDTVEMAYDPGNATDIRRGFICVAPTTTWLKSLEIKKDGKTIVDDASGFFGFAPQNDPWYGEEESIRNRTYFMYPYTADESPAQVYALYDTGVYPSVAFGDGTPQALLYWPVCKAHRTPLSPDIWRSGNSNYEKAQVRPGSALTVQLTKAADSYDMQEKAGELEVYTVYWADLSVKDDNACLSEGGRELVCPTKKGFHMLILLTEYGVFSKMIRVV